MTTEQELDPRWIVRELGEEGKNVGNWHWTERNCIEWAKKTLKKAFKDSYQNHKLFRSKITFKSIEGDCIVMNRKGRFFGIYEVKIELSWKAEMLSQSGEEKTEAKGKIIIPYIGEENEIDEFDVKFELNDDYKKSKHEKLKKLVEQTTEKQVRSKISLFVADLKAGADYKDILPQSRHKISPFEEDSFKKVEEKNIIKEAPKVVDKKPINILNNILSTPTKVVKKFQELKMKQNFKTTSDVIFQCFLDPKRIAAFTQSRPDVDPKVDGRVSYYNGKLEGKITKLSTNKLIEFSVKMADWKSDEYSKVSIKLESDLKNGHTKLTLHQTDIPEKGKGGVSIKKKSLENFWNEMFLKRINIMFARGFSF